MAQADMTELTALLKKLVSINSVNPDLVPEASGEKEIASFIAGWLKNCGLEVYMEDCGRDGRPNIVAIARGAGGGRSLMLNAHMDTVGTSGMKRPFDPDIRGGHLFGRGALDTKGALAAFMLATAEAGKSGLKGDVILTAVADEEFGSVGTDAIAHRWKADAAIVGEPTGLELVIAHKGFAWFEIETRGFAAHGSLPDVGVDAIVKMGKVLEGLDTMASQLAASECHPLLGPGSVHASLIEGGQELSSYPASCRLSIERRTLPGEDIEAIEEGLRSMLDRIRRDDPAFSASLKTMLFRGPLEASMKEPIVEVLARHTTTCMGKEPGYKGMGGWMDSAVLAAAGIPSVVFGPAGEGLHGTDEWVDLASVQQCYEIVLGTIKDFCG